MIDDLETKEDGTKNCKLTRFLVSPVKYFENVLYLCYSNRKESLMPELSRF